MPERTANCPTLLMHNEQSGARSRHARGCRWLASVRLVAVTRQHRQHFAQVHAIVHTPTGRRLPSERPAKSRRYAALVGAQPFHVLAITGDEPTSRTKQKECPRVLAHTM